MGSGMITTIIDALAEFVSGMGSAFVSAFQNLFMIAGENGTYSGINDLGQFILVLFGLGLGYGAIRFVMGLFRKGTK